MLQGAEPYRFPGTNDTAVLLIHGYTGSPSELRELGERLHYKGYTVQGLLLNGHGTNPEDLDGVTYEKWTQSVKSAASALKETYGKVVLVGMSMGGLLALDCASTVPVDGVIVISTPIYLFDWRSHFLWLADQFPSALVISTLRPAMMWPITRCPFPVSANSCVCCRQSKSAPFLA